MQVIFYENIQIISHKRFYFFCGSRDCRSFLLRLVRRQSADRPYKSCQRIYMGTYETCIFPCSPLVVFSSDTPFRRSAVSAPRTLIQQSSRHTCGSGSFLYLLRYPGKQYCMGRYPDIFYQRVYHFFLYMEVAGLCKNRSKKNSHIFSDCSLHHTFLSVYFSAT